MHKLCGDGIDDTNPFAVVKLPDVRVLASRVFLADDKKPPQDAKAKAEAELKKKLEEASRLQQQLDAANRQLRTCKK